EADEKMLLAGKKHLPGGHGQVWIYLPDAYRDMRDASPNAGKVTKAELEAMAHAIFSAEWEAAGEPPEDASAIATSILSGIDHNWEDAAATARHAARAALASLGLEVER
ncbi:MAG TPA: hypothetical protein DCF73_11005, partial [Rhodobiaceae bacterium]|nr:hypothetical protein [Rhodobiaceae bacterium]